MTVRERIAALRKLMQEQNLAAYYVPSTDPHASEYVAETWQRRAFISGFNGSAGTVAITTSAAGLWTDSRYFLQAEAQLADTGVDLFKMGEPGVPDVEPWLASALKPGDKLGLDPRVVTIAAFDALKSVLSPHGVVVTPVSRDLVEIVWGTDRPPVPCTPLRLHPLEFAGLTTDQKLVAVRQAMAAEKADAYVLAGLDEVAWLFNLRAADVPYNPVLIAYAIVEPKSVTLFIDKSRVTPEIASALGQSVTIRGYDELDQALHSVAKARARVWVDPATVNQAVADVVWQFGGEVVRKPGCIAGIKGVKNSAELTAIRQAHLRDGVSMVQLLAWLGRAVDRGFETEVSVARKAQEFRQGNQGFVGMSFSTIVGYGPHGAIVHYSPTEETDSALQPEGILLIDSGAQYVDGTTDITRTVTLGKPTQEQKRAYTAVLKGHLALSRARFPVGTNGYQLDIVARSALWEQGYSYGHGTGHGVGASLCVHEGPFSVSLRKNLTPMAAGNVLSNEPGYYKTGHFGIRIENLMVVVERGNEEFGTFLALEPLTLCPYCRDLIDKSMLTAVEIQQVNQYHHMVMEILGNRLSREDRDWLSVATWPL